LSYAPFSPENLTPIHFAQWGKQDSGFGV